MPSVSAVPAPSPGVPTGNPGYINASTSGVVPTTGTSACDFSGPWFIETQTMSLDYVRIPRYLANNSNLELSLDGTPQKDFYIADTRLVCRVNAHVQAHKSDDECYDTSSWQQSQKFAVLGASADHNGSSYGLNADFTASTLGPAGAIVTYQPYYRRRPWVASDTSHNSSVTVYNSYAFSVHDHGSASAGGTAGLYHAELGTYFSGVSIEDSFFQGDLDPFTYGGPSFGKPWSARTNQDLGYGGVDDGFMCYAPHYRIVGQYGYEKEDFYALVDLVNELGSRVGSENLFPDTVQYTPSNNIFKEGLAEYDANRHDWS